LIMTYSFRSIINIVVVIITGCGQDKPLVVSIDLCNHLRDRDFFNFNFALVS